MRSRLLLGQEPRHRATHRSYTHSRLSGRGTGEENTWSTADAQMYSVKSHSKASCKCCSSVFTPTATTSQHTAALLSSMQLSACLSGSRSTADRANPNSAAACFAQLYFLAGRWACWQHCARSNTPNTRSPGNNARQTHHHTGSPLWLYHHTRNPNHCLQRTPSAWPPDHQQNR